MLTANVVPFLPSRDQLFLRSGDSLRPLDFRAMLGQALKEKGPIPKGRVMKERRRMPGTNEFRVETSFFRITGTQLVIPATRSVYRQGPESEREAILRAVVNLDRQIFQKCVYKAVYDTPHSKTAFFDLDCDDTWETIVNEGKRPKQFFFYSRGGKSNQRIPIAVALQFSKTDFVFCVVDEHYLLDTMAHFHLG